MNLYEIFKIEKEEIEINNMSPLVWAYIGDCIFELHIRNKLINETMLKPHKLHVEAIKHVKAEAQAKTLFKIMESLTEDEKEIVRRTRNTENHHSPKNADMKDYMYATAFEGLIGYLYLTKQDERLKQILDMCD